MLMVVPALLGGLVRKSPVRTSARGGLNLRLQLESDKNIESFKEIESFQNIAWPKEWPFSDSRYFARADDSPDAVFYEQPRFVTHIDDSAIGSLTAYYARAIPAKADVLDICSSWVSHLPSDLQLGRVAGLGMNDAEVRRWLILR